MYFHFEFALQTVRYISDRENKIVKQKFTNKVKFTNCQTKRYGGGEIQLIEIGEGGARSRNSGSIQFLCEHLSGGHRFWRTPAKPQTTKLSECRPWADYHKKRYRPTPPPLGFPTSRSYDWVFQLPAFVHVREKEDNVRPENIRIKMQWHQNVVLPLTYHSWSQWANVLLLDCQSWGPRSTCQNKREYTKNYAREERYAIPMREPRPFDVRDRRWWW